MFGNPRRGTGCRQDPRFHRLICVGPASVRNLHDAARRRLANVAARSMVSTHGSQADSQQGSLMPSSMASETRCASRSGSSPTSVQHCRMTSNFGSIVAADCTLDERGVVREFRPLQFAPKPRNSIRLDGNVGLSCRVGVEPMREVFQFWGMFHSVHAACGARLMGAHCFWLLLVAARRPRRTRRRGKTRSTGNEQHSEGTQSDEPEVDATTGGDGESDAALRVQLNRASRSPPNAVKVLHSRPNPSRPLRLTARLRQVRLRARRRPTRKRTPAHLVKP